MGRFRYIIYVMGKKEVLGIIPARGGSKSIPRKNLKSFCGKPLLAWAIETLKASGVVNRVVVSTEESEIADIAREYGAEVPFMRPAELAQDTTPTLPVIQHALQTLKDNERYWPSYAVLLEPTSVGKRPQHVKGVLALLIQSGADSCFSVSEVPSTTNPYWQLKVDPDGRVELFMGGSIKDIIPRRQELPKTYFRSGSIYAFKPELLLAKEPSFYGEDARAYIVESKYAIDIDSPDDWEFAEWRFKKILAEESNQRI